jgi:hypothetical protein
VGVIEAARPDIVRRGMEHFGEWPLSALEAEHWVAGLRHALPSYFAQPSSAGTDDNFVLSEAQLAALNAMPILDRMTLFRKMKAQHAAQQGRAGAR